MTIPWREEAVVVRLSARGGARAQVHSGILWQVVEWVREHPDRDQLTIWLPERRAPPNSFDATAIRELLLRVDRPLRTFGFG